MTVQDLLSKTYDAESYNCAHFAADAWLQETGEDLRDRLDAVIHGEPPTELLTSFGCVENPVGPALVTMRRRGDRQAHMGVLARGRVWHMRETGPHLATRRQLHTEYTDLRYYQWRV